MKIDGKMTGLAAAMVLALAACKGKAGSGEANEAPGVPVSVVTLQARPVPVSTVLPGRVVASLEAEVRPQVAGLIQKRLFEEGSEVQAGQPLYRIEPATYEAAYASAQANLVKARATVPGAESKVSRYRDLVTHNAVSRQDFEDAKDTLAQARANVAVAKAAVETARINLEYTTVRAPISGRIGRSSLTPGALVTASQTTALATIQQIDTVYVDLTQSSASLISLRQAIEAGRLRKPGGTVSVKLKLENGTEYPLAGSLAFSESTVNAVTGTYTLRAVLRNPARLLLPGMYVRARIEEGIVPHGFLVPQRAVSRNAQGEATALLVGNGKVVERVLPDARQVGNDWLVQTGLTDGDQIIVEGAQQVRQGDAVTPVKVALDSATGGVRALSAAHATPASHATPPGPAALGMRPPVQTSLTSDRQKNGS